MGQRGAHLEEHSLQGQLQNGRLHDLFTFHTKFRPDQLQAVYLSDRSMSGTKDNVEISHGRLSIEEMIVSLVQLVNP